MAVAHGFSAHLENLQVLAVGKGRQFGVFINRIHCSILMFFILLMQPLKSLLSRFMNLAQLSPAVVDTSVLLEKLLQGRSLKEQQLGDLGSLFAEECVKSFRVYLLLFIRWDMKPLVAYSWLKAPCGFQLNMVQFVSGQISSRTLWDEGTQLLDVTEKLLMT